MIDYRMQRRLSYIGGGIRAQMSAWPDVGANWWEPTTGSFTCVGAYQAKGAASLAASYVNLANPGTYDLTPGSPTPAWDGTTGWGLGDGSPNFKYLQTGIVATNSMSAIVRASSINQTDGCLFGVTHTGQVQFNLFAAYSDGKSYYRAGGNYTHGSRYTSGTFAVTPAAAYVNGSSVGSLTGALSGSTSYTIIIGGQNANGALGSLAKNIQAIAFYSGTLTATQVGELTTSINAL